LTRALPRLIPHCYARRQVPRALFTGAIYERNPRAQSTGAIYNHRT